MRKWSRFCWTQETDCGTGALAGGAKHGKLASMELLLTSGAEVNELGIITDDKRSLLHAGTGKSPDLLVSRGCALTYFLAALPKGIERGHPELVDMLLEAGTDAGIRDGRGRTAADIAVEKGSGAGLLEKLAQPENSKA
jgi:hypothetical protein